MIYYYPIENYAVKCRLYPNKTQAEQIDNLIDAARLFHNAALYDILENKNPHILKEKPSKDNPDEVVHFIDFYKMKKASYLNTLRNQDPRIARLPGDSLSGKSIGVVEDMKKAWEKTGKHPVEHFGGQYIDEDGNKVTIGITYYNSKRKRFSFSYRTVLNNIIFTDNPKVLKLKITSRNYPVDGEVKVKGFNNNLRFDASCEMTFRDWVETYTKKIRVTVSKDSCGDYYVVFMLPLVYKPIREAEEKSEEVGIDVGEIDIMTTFDGNKGKKYGNLKNSNKYIKKEQKGLEILNRRMSRKEGFKNEKFLDRYKEEKSKGNYIQCSKSYMSDQKASNRINRRITRQRKDFQSKAVMDVLGSAKNVSIEGLRVRDLIERKNVKENKKTQ